MVEKIEDAVANAINNLDRYNLKQGEAIKWVEDYIVFIMLFMKLTTVFQKSLNIKLEDEKINLKFSPNYKIVKNKEMLDSIKVSSG